MSLLLISGSTRSASTNTALLRTAARLAGGAVLYEGMSALPHFNPDDDAEPLPAPVADLRRAVERAGAVLFCTPEYAGTLPGSFKNLLDWLVGGTEIAGKPVAWVNAAADARRGNGAIATLETVLGYVQAEVVREACVHVPVARDAITPEGLVAGEATAAALADVLARLGSAAAGAA